jgi:peptidoglycan/xylan/chitin deacetylase (PgdA/CDA1 family)
VAFRRPAIRWPNGARLAIVPGVAFETWPEDLGRADSLQNQDRRAIPKDAPFNRDLAVVTDREYGERVGIYRMLDLFDRTGIRTTFFFNGINAERFPELTKQIDAAGHEVASENWIHDYSFMKTREHEDADQKKTVAAITRATGKHPGGYLSTGVRPTLATPELAAENGYTYWMDPQHEELPYTLVVGATRLVVINYNLSLNDYTTYGKDRTPRELGELWHDTVEYLHREGERYPSVVTWGLHPFLSGRPFRAKVLEEFIVWAKALPGVWFARTRDIAEWWRAEYPEHLVEQWPHFTERGVPYREAHRPGR